MPVVDLPADEANELPRVKVIAPTVRARAAAPGMAARGDGTIVKDHWPSQFAFAPAAVLLLAG